MDDWNISQRQEIEAICEDCLTGNLYSELRRSDDGGSDTVLDVRDMRNIGCFAQLTVELVSQIKREISHWLSLTAVNKL